VIASGGACAVPVTPVVCTGGNPGHVQPGSLPLVAPETFPLADPRHAVDPAGFDAPVGLYERSARCRSERRCLATGCRNSRFLSVSIARRTLSVALWPRKTPNDPSDGPAGPGLLNRGLPRPRFRP
jgi:hypothetical protein